MLDAFIIDHIRRENHRQKDVREPLTIEVPRPPPSHPSRHRDEKEHEERGIAIIDFSI